jgi:hypothetical protein
MNTPLQSRRFLFSVLAALLLAIGAAHAQPAPPSARQAPPPPPPANLEPIPEISNEGDLEPQVTIGKRDGDTVEEARVNGRLVWIKVTPTHGRPYFLVPDGGGYTFTRRDSLDSGLKVPLWLLFTF